jgi:hypothetical protein
MYLRCITISQIEIGNVTPTKQLAINHPTWVSQWVLLGKPPLLKSHSLYTIQTSTGKPATTNPASENNTAKTTFPHARENTFCLLRISNNFTIT